MNPLIPAVLMGLAVALAMRTESTHRLAMLRPPEPTPRGVDGKPRGPLISRPLAAGSASALMVVLVSLPLALVLAPLVFFVVYAALGRLEPRSVRRQRENVRRDLPLALDLLAACAEAGATPSKAARAVADSVGIELGERLLQVAARLELGATPEHAWSVLGSDPELIRVARTAARADQTGAAAAKVLRRMADEQRQRSRRRAEAAARRVSVRAAGPLGLCFLPAFVLLGIVPAVLGALAPLSH